MRIWCRRHDRADHMLADNEGFGLFRNDSVEHPLDHVIEPRLRLTSADTKAVIGEGEDAAFRERLGCADIGFSHAAVTGDQHRSAVDMLDQVDKPRPALQPLAQDMRCLYSFAEG